MELLTRLDTVLFLVLNADVANPVFDVIFPAITHGRFWLIPALIAAVLFIRREKRGALIVIGLSLVTVAVTDPVSSYLIKPLFGRLRPCHPDVLVEGGRFLLGHKGSLSFPSSHAMNMFGQAMLFTCFYPKNRPWYFGFAALIGYSRIYTGTHYPLDVAGGAVFGVICGSAVYHGYVLVTRKTFRPHR